MSKDIAVPADRHMLEIVVAAPGTPLPDGAGSSLTGHMFYVLHKGSASTSFGFQPSPEGGVVTHSDKQAYSNPFYTRTMEITEQQYKALEEFGARPGAFGFKELEYDAFTNNCAEFTWAALNHAGLHKMFSMPGELPFALRNFNGDMKPLNNIDDIRSIEPPIPGSELNRETRNPMPERSWGQRLLSEQSGDPPLLQQASAAVARRDAELGREPDESSRRIAVAGASLAARSGYERIDDIVFNLQTNRLAAGERFFVLQGGRDDPAHLRESMLTRDALALSPGQVKQQTSQLEMAQARTQEAPVQEHASRMPSPAGPHLG